MDHSADTIHCNDLPWLPLAPRVFVKIIKLVPETGGFSVMIRAEPGAVLPRHKHLESAEIAPPPFLSPLCRVGTTPIMRQIF